jgi:Holliday junction resolvasome RuvABC endonuclease subunit
MTLFKDKIGPGLPEDVERIIGVDPSSHNTAVAILTVERGAFKVLKADTIRIKDLYPGTYSTVLANMKAAGAMMALIEDTPGTGKMGSHSLQIMGQTRGMAMEAVGIIGIQVFLITVSEWRGRILGMAPQTRQAGGGVRRYWTKGNTKEDIPDNVTPACQHILKAFLPENQVHAMSTGELESCCIALAGLDMWRHGDLEFT